MGILRSQPCLKKASSTSINKSYTVGEASMCGWRIFMEDAHIICTGLPGNDDTSLFAIFDGHGGAEVAQFAAARFIETFENNVYLFKCNYFQALRATFIEIDELMLSETGEKYLLYLQQDNFKKGNGDRPNPKTNAGCTAIVCVITQNYLYCANAGDARAIASVDHKLVELSQDHTTEKETQRKRIISAGGYIQKNRVNGTLSPCRGFGDFSYKKQKSISPQEQIVTANPDVMQIKLTGLYYVFMGCDGIWEVRNSEEMKHWIDARLTKQRPNSQLHTILEDLLDQTVDLTGEALIGRDNMTAILIKFNHG